MIKYIKLYLLSLITVNYQKELLELLYKLTQGCGLVLNIVPMPHHSSADIQLKSNLSCVIMHECTLYKEYNVFLMNLQKTKETKASI